VLFGIFLASIKVYPEDSVPWEATGGRRGGFTLPTEFRYKRLVLWVLIDTVTILLAWYLAFLVRYSESPQWDLQIAHFTSSAPIALLSVLVALFARGLYRSDWQTFSLHETRAIIAGALLGLAATVAALTLLEPDRSISPTLFVVAFGAVVLMLAGTRAFVRMLADALRRHPEGSERVLIYGAGVGGELALREIRGNAALGKEPVGFIDDDPLRRGMTIHGVPVLGGLTELERIVGHHRVAAILISTGKLTADRQTRLSTLASEHGVALYRLEINLIPIPTDS
jgi:UDP-GlcNAc:undecaprenyl-phosphate GlcNAc-1-phosphate transferase